MSNTDLLLFEKRGHVGYLTLNRPEKRNPLGLSGDGEAFAAAARKINGDFDLRCVIMTGAGSAFSAGGDLKAMRDRTGDFGVDNLRLRDHYRESIHGIIKAMWHFLRRKILELNWVLSVLSPPIILRGGGIITCLVVNIFLFVS